MSLPRRIIKKSGLESFGRAFLLAFALALVFTALGSADLGRLFARFLSDQILCDFFTRLKPTATQIPRRIVLVDLANPGEERTDRLLVAKAVERCLKSGAAAVGVDVLLDASLPGDDLLVAAISQSPGRVVLVTDLKGLALPPAFSKLGGLRLGFGNFLATTQDPVIRRAALWLENQGRRELSFSTQVLAAAGLSPLLEAVPPVLRGRLRIDFPDDPKFIFTVLKVEDLLSTAPGSRLNMSGHLVLLGNLSGPAEHKDLLLTPVGEIPGVYLHALTLETLLKGKFYRTLPEILAGASGPVDLIAFLILTGLIAPLALFFRRRTARGTVLGMVLLIFGFIIAGYLSFTRLDLILPMSALITVTPILGLFRLWSLGADLDRDMRNLEVEHNIVIDRLKTLKLFEPFRELELSLRNLAAHLFAMAYGDDWEDQALQRLGSKKFWIEKRDELRAQFPHESINFLCGTTYGDWSRILDKCWDLFEPVFGDEHKKDLLLDDLKDIRKVRNMVYHSNPVSEALKERVLEHCQRITKVIKTI